MNEGEPVYCIMRRRWLFRLNNNKIKSINLKKIHTEFVWFELLFNLFFSFYEWNNIYNYISDKWYKQEKSLNDFDRYIDCRFKVSEHWSVWLKVKLNLDLGEFNEEFIYIWQVDCFKLLFKYN